jgi:hypothetical protein
MVRFLYGIQIHIKIVSNKILNDLKLNLNNIKR